MTAAITALRREDRREGAGVPGTTLASSCFTAETAIPSWDEAEVFPSDEHLEGSEISLGTGQTQATDSFF